jgi:rhodanese-related sulfurtransferase
MDGEITPDSLADRLETDGEEAPLVLDIRSPRAFRQGHIPGSENLPLQDLTGEVEAVDGADHVVTVCPHGEASVQAARLITAYEGFDGTVESLAGGLVAWEGPLEEGTHSDDSASAVAGDGSPRPPDGEDADSPEAPF